MLRRIAIECTRCHSRYELLLGNEAPMLVMGCPSCGGSLLHAGGVTFGLAEADAEALCGDEGRAAHILRRVAHGGSAVGGSSRVQVRLLPPPPRREARVITADDILDLRIELALCRDAREFVERIG